MRRLLITLALMSCIIHSKLQSQESPQEPKTTATGHYLFAWTGDAAHKGNDFLAVIDADPASKSYGQLMTTLATDQQRCGSITQNMSCPPAACCLPTIMRPVEHSSLICATHCIRRR